MGHAPGTTTLEEFYLEFNYLTNSAAALLGEDVADHDQQAELQSSTREQVRMRLDKEHLVKTQGSSLNTLVAELLANDPGYQRLENEREIKNWQRRTRRHALDILYEQTHKEFRLQVTRESIHLRDEEAKQAHSEASDFANSIRRLIHEPKQQRS